MMVQTFAATTFIFGLCAGIAITLLGILIFGNWYGDHHDQRRP